MGPGLSLPGTPCRTTRTLSAATVANVKAETYAFRVPIECIAYVSSTRNVRSAVNVSCVVAEVSWLENSGRRNNLVPIQSFENEA